MKKKITMLFAALLACVGVAKAQEVFSNENLKEIVPGDYYIYYTDANSVKHYLQTTGTNSFSIVTENPKLYSISVGGGSAYGKAYYIQMNGLCFSNPDPNNNHTLTTGTIGWNATAYISTVVFENGEGLCALRSTNAPVTTWDENYFITHDENHNVTVQEGSVGGESLFVWTIEEAKEVEMTYKFMYNEELKYEVTVTGYVGENYPTYSGLPFGVVAAMPEGKVTADVTEATIELSPAFPWADSYENITAWYYLDLKDGKYLYYEENQTNIPLDKSEVDSNNKDAYTWGFIGDPFNGFQIVNRAAGSSMILSSTTNTFDGNTGGNTYPVMTTIPVPDGNNTHWVFTASGYRENGFYIGQKDANNGNNRLNNRGGKLAYWNGGADGGSTFVMVERPMGAVAELAALLEEIEAMGVVGGENIGDYTVASATALNEAVAAAKAVETATAEDVATLQAALDGLRIVLPDANKFYAFNCVYENRKLYINANNQLTYAENYDLTNSRAVFQFEEGSQPNTVKIKSVHNQSYMGAISGNPITFGATGADITIARSVSNELTDEQKPLAVMFTTDGTNGLHANGGNVQAYTNIAISNHYILSEVTEFKHALTIDEYDYMTLTLGFNAEVPEGVTAYKVTGTEGKELTLESVGTVIPAGEPVIVYAEVEAEGTKTAEFAYTTAEATKSGDNLLKGTLVDNSAVAPTTGYDAYVMALNGTEVVMGKAVLTEGQFKNRANKAYLELPTVQDAPAMFSFGRGEGTTGIETAVNGEQTAVIYDLAGRRVEKMEKGIYIVNGKKVIK